MPSRYILHPAGSGRVQVIFAVGDIHGLWSQLNIVINKDVRQNSRLRRLAEATEVEVVVLQCGDFGYWPHTPYRVDAVTNIKNEVPFLRDGHVKIYWCDGNHDNHDAMDELERQHPGQSFIEVAPHIHFATFGSVLELAVGKVLFVGGALSSDKESRILGETWWAQETIDDADMARLPDMASLAGPAATQIDIVISHTSPRIFPTPRWTDHAKINDPSRAHLDIVFSRYRPRRWFYGHYHAFSTGYHDGCQWTGLGTPGLAGSQWYVNVEEKEEPSAFGPADVLCNE